MHSPATYKSLYLWPSKATGNNLGYKTPQCLLLVLNFFYDQHITMDTITTSNDYLKPGEKPIPNAAVDKFIPKGAIAFFILLMLVCLAIWFGIYYIMINRS